MKCVLRMQPVREVTSTVNFLQNLSVAQANHPSDSQHIATNGHPSMAGRVPFSHIEEGVWGSAFNIGYFSCVTQNLSHMAEIRARKNSTSRFQLFPSGDWNLWPLEEMHRLCAQKFSLLPPLVRLRWGLILALVRPLFCCLLLVSKHNALSSGEAYLSCVRM